MNKEEYLIPGTTWILEEGKICNIKDANACIIRFSNAAFVVYSIIHNRYAANESISMNQEATSKEAFLEMWKPEPDNDMNEIVKDDEEPSESTHFNMVDSAIDALKNMDGSTTNYLKMDGEKAQFESGAIRYTKTGKGRFDLIVGNVISDIVGYAYDLFHEKPCIAVSKMQIIENAYCGDPFDRFSNTIINIIIHHYAPVDIVQDDNGLPAMEATFVSFSQGFLDMLKDLAVHYENGAEKYGVDNWKKGIPVTGGDRGGSFMDSAMRHLNQYLQDLKDEPHYISCIWNCVCGLYTLHEEEKKKK